MLKTIFAMIVMVFILIGYLFFIAEYEAIKKYYPDMTFMEYILINDKLRITPNGQ